MDSIKKFKGYGLYLSPELFNSRAWNDIGIYGHRLFFELHKGLKYKRTKKNGVQYTNNGELSFKQDEFCKKYGCCKATYTKARNELIRVGLIRITHKGGNGKGDYTTYKLTYCGNANPLPNNDSPRWKFYDGENKHWENEIPKSKHKIGNRTRWKKGESGRKKISTLSKHTLNGTTPPIETYP